MPPTALEQVSGVHAFRVSGEFLCSTGEPFLRQYGTPKFFRWVPVRAVWPATRLLPAKTQLFLDYLAARLKAERL